MKAAIIGRGRWGKIIKPYIKDHFEVVSITGQDSDIPELAKRVGVFFIATPIDTHYEIIKKCLEQKKHVFVEKPLSTSYEECLELKAIAEKNGVKLFTDYVEMYAPSRLKMVELSGLCNILNLHCSFSKYEPSLQKNIFWHLTCHSLSVLSLFVDLSKLDFWVNGRMINFHSKEFFNGGLYCRLDLPIENEKKIIIKTKSNNCEIIYDKNYVYPIRKLNDKEKHYYKFDENNNLFHSVKYFKDLIEGKVKSNIDTDIEITRILENLSH